MFKKKSFILSEVELLMISTTPYGEYLFSKISSISSTRNKGVGAFSKKFPQKLLVSVRFFILVVSQRYFIWFDLRRIA